MNYRLLDLFCGAGGASMGYYRAGFEVEGVDIKPQPHYPFKFYQADALEFPLEGYDAYHASPPCQGYSSHTNDDSKWVHYHRGKQTPKLIIPTRQRLLTTGRPFVIENIPDAKTELRAIILLCGSMFGLPINRHRLFETNFPLLAPGHGKCKGRLKKHAAANNLDYDNRIMSVTGKGRHAGCIEIWKRLMGITWPMRQADIVEAIPPAYTEYIGKYLIKHLST